MSQGPGGGSSSVGRASAFQAEGRGFESRFPLHSSRCGHGFWPLTGSRGWPNFRGSSVPSATFSDGSRPGELCPYADSECRTTPVASRRAWTSPRTTTRTAHVAQLVEHVLGKDEVNGSIPFLGSSDAD